MSRSLVISALRFSWLLASVTLACPSFAVGPNSESDLEGAAPMAIDRGAVRDLQARARALGISASLGDTTWIGYTPGHFDAAKNWWSIHAGSTSQGYGLPRNGQPGKGMWNWDEPVHGDSLQGWSPTRAAYSVSFGSDRDRSFACIDIGNLAHSVVPEARGADWQNRGTGTEPGWRTHGVDGMWHVDGGSTVTVAGLPAPAWSPLEGTRSAWMGLRAHGDATHVDPLTGNPYNEDVWWYPTSRSSPPYFGSRFPGYLGRVDQMLYRDIDLGGTPDTSLTISFRYQTSMSTFRFTSTRFGWFNHDPLTSPAGATNPQPNNFISATDAGVAAGGGAPVDSFMVYIGSGVDGGPWRGSDGSLRDVYDPKHRWFAEVLHTDWDPTSDPADPRPLYYRQLLSVAGDVTATTVSFTIPSGILQQFLEKGPRIRLVFRVKTNHGGDDDRDQSGTYSSNHAGAAVVDDVRIRIGAGPQTAVGDFEDLSAIDNHPATSALDAWKSTGKSPTLYFHPEQLDQITYDIADVCGQKGEIGRACSASMGVLLSGDHDRGEEVGTQILGDWNHDGLFGAMSPTIPLVDDDGDPETPNPIGLFGIGGNGGRGDIQGELVLRFDYRHSYYSYNAGWLMLMFTIQGYPEMTSGSSPHPIWGQNRFPPFQGFFDHRAPLCITETVPLNSLNVIRTSNANGIPDSIRIGLFVIKSDYSFGIPGDDPNLDAPYFDNVSLGIVDVHPVPLSRVESWWQDAFPASEDPLAPGNPSLFDTTAAHVKLGGRSEDHCVSGDSIVVQSPGARVDLVFRVLPGPGNYEPVGDGVAGMLRRVPSSAATVTPGDGSWWDVLRQNPGDFASPNAASLLQNAAGGWDPNVWVSVRCDSAEMNLYPRQGVFPTTSSVRWQTTVHEADSRFEALGGVRNRCFVRTATGSTGDIVCDGSVPSYLPPGTVGTTKEGTKIIPDGLLTPGAHVQYFFRAQTQEAPGTAWGIYPDTAEVAPQVMVQGSGYYDPDQFDRDGHRWQQFSVLPDRWKDPQYFHPVLRRYGAGPACLLVVDWDNRSGDEAAWVSVADTIGATDAVKFGAHNGWHARGDQDVNDPAVRVARHGGSPGTTWDLYQVDTPTGTGTLGTRLADRGTDPLIISKASRHAPTPEMLRAYYTLMLILSGDLSYGISGPDPDNGQFGDDIGILEDWLDSGSNQTPNRGLWVLGNGFVTGLIQGGGPAGAARAAFATNYLRVGLLNTSLRTLTQNTDYLLNLAVFPEWQGKGAGQLYGILNPCLTSNLDVLQPATVQLTQVTSQYEAVGAPGFGHAAGIFKQWDPSSPYMTQVDGFSIRDLTGYGNHNTTGRALYFWKVFTNVFAQIWSVAGTVAPLDVPQLAGDDLVNFVRLLGNPATDGRARVRFGLTRADRVEALIYDVAGRRVRVLADRNFPAGEHELVWDGLDQAGNRVARGVYFTRFSYRALGFETSRKVTILR